MAYKPKVLLGVTGYLGSGKSTAIKYFEKYGYFVIDADKVVHALYEPGKDGWRKIKDFFGEEYLVGGKGKVNRPKLRKVVFNNTTAPDYTADTYRWLFRQLQRYRGYDEYRGLHS